MSGHVHQVSLLQRYFLPFYTLDHSQQVRPTLRRRVRSIRVRRDILQPDSNKYFGRHLEVMQVPFFFSKLFFYTGQKMEHSEPQESLTLLFKKCWVIYFFHYSLCKLEVPNIGDMNSWQSGFFLASYRNSFCSF